MPEYALAMSEGEIRRYLMMAERARASEADLWAMAGIGAGATVADVGCGPGAMTAVLAQQVGPEGHVFGIEPDPPALEAARRLIGQAQLTNVTLHQGNAQDCGLPPGSVDVAMMRNVLAHNQPSEREIVNALATLVRPGGFVYLMDIEGTAIRLLDAIPEALEITDKYHAFHRLRGNDLMTGLRLGKLVTSAGLELLAHRGWYEIVTPPPGFRPPAWAARDAMLEAGVVTEAELERWSAAMDRMDTNPQQLTAFLPSFVAVGRKPL